MGIALHENTQLLHACQDGSGFGIWIYFQPHVVRNLPAGLVICSARTYTRDYQDTLAYWEEAGVEVWGSIPERVAVAAGPEGWLAAEALEAYGAVWRKGKRAATR